MSVELWGLIGLAVGPWVVVWVARHVRVKVRIEDDE